MRLEISPRGYGKQIEACSTAPGRAHRCDARFEGGVHRAVDRPPRASVFWQSTRAKVAAAITPATPATPHAPVLYLLDEFAALGYLAPVERAIGLMAGYGVQIWPILQDSHQLRATYTRRAGSFFSNAGVLQVFGVNDADTAKLVSELLGQQTIVFSTVNVTEGSFINDTKPSVSHAEQRTGRPLMIRDEVRTLHPDRQLLFIAGRRPTLAGKIVYHHDRRFDGLYDPA